MNANDVFRVALVTVPDIEIARQITKIILEARLAACVNILPKVESHYWWKGKIQKDSEVMLVIKTKTAKIQHLEEAVIAAHPYDTPEFITLPIVEGSPPYMKWLAESTT